VTGPIPTQGTWWRAFFESEDSIPLSFFPPEEETSTQVAALRRLLDLRPGQLIADICCGMGRHAVRLAAEALDVVGLDTSAMMLAAARQAAQDDVRPLLVRGDAQRLPLRSESLDVVLNLFNSFGYFEDEAANQRVLDETARCLRPGGLFLLETRNREHQILYAPYYSEVTLADGSPAVMRCRYDRDRHTLLSTWSRPGDPEAVLHRAAIRLYGLDELADMLRHAGMTISALWGDYQGTEVQGFERMLIVLARKPA
jgi:ubiquinone/menaquinone biosynthesis C-methylase UbiE